MNLICLSQNLESQLIPKSVLLKTTCFPGAPDEDVDSRSRAVEFLRQQAVQHIIVCGGVYGRSNLQDVPAGLEDIPFAPDGFFLWESTLIS